MFCALNGHQLDVPAEETVTTMLAVVAGELDEAGLPQWLAEWVDRES
jgi:prophage maintenance system killer protein